MGRFADSFDLFLIVILTFAATSFALVQPAWGEPFRAVFGLAFVLLAPGYVVMTLLFPGHDDIEGVERLVVSLGMSVASVVLIGLALNSTPWKLTLASTALGLGVFVLGLAAASLARRLRLPAEERFHLPLASASFVRVGLIAGVGVSIYLIANLAVLLQPLEQPTEFYVLGENGRLESYPTALQAGETFVLTFGITNREGSPQSFLIEFPFDPTQPPAESPALDQGETWETSLQLTTPASLPDSSLNFDLYRNGDPNVYRTLVIQATVDGAVESSTPAGALP